MEQTDLIILDLVMPVKDGFDVLYKLSGDVFTSTIPIIVLTNKADLGTKLKVFTRGTRHFFIKSETSLETLILKVIQI